MKQRKKTLFISLVLGAACFAFCHAAAAESPSSSLSYGYQKYFQYHPPKEKIVKNNLYPFAGPILQQGQDIPVCAAARTAGAYARKKEIRYLRHGKDGWLFRTIDFRSDFIATPKVLGYFDRLNKALAARGQKLVVAFQPTRGIMASRHLDPQDIPKEYTPEKARQGYKYFLQQLENLNIATTDLSEAPADFEYFPKGDFHWTADGARYTAQKIAEVIKKTAPYQEIEKKDFQSEITGMGPADRGAFEEFIQQTCRTNIELTTEPLWTTHAVTSGTADADSLLGDTAFPAITVLGTSNSSEDAKFNFVGSLKHFTRADIYNAAVTGGGFGSSSYRYYASEEYRAHPPKILVWEFLPQHNYNNAESLNAFRQMIPAIHGACSEKTAIAEYSGVISRGQTEIFTSLKGRPLKNSYLYLEVMEPKERDLKVEVLYKNGEADQVDLTRSTRSENNGKYYLELADHTEKNALLFHVITNTPQGHMTARICQYPTQVAEK